MTQKWAPETVVVETARPPRAHDAALNPPVVMSSTFIGSADIGSAGEDVDGIQYGRFGNPTWAPFERALAELEHAELPGLVFASGLAAVSAALELVAPAGTVIMPRHSYLGALSAARDSAAVGRFDVVTVDIADTDAVNEAVSAATARHAGANNAVLLWLESPTNPMLEVADLPALIAHAKGKGVLTVVDNTFSTPLVQQPLRAGADVVIHSVTKYLAGHSDVVLGAAATSNAALHQALLHHRSIRGAVAGPWEVWLALRGLRTLALRVERSQRSAMTLAERLTSYQDIEVRFPGLPQDPGHARASAQMSGFGSVLCIVLPTAAEARVVSEATELWTPATSLGGVESLIERRRRNAHEATSVPEGLLRLSVGIEHVDDLWHDLAQALDRATGRA